MYSISRSALGQADLIAVIILIATTIVVGVGFLGLVYPNIADLTYQNELRMTLYNEQSLLVLFKEYENSTHVCTGFLRIDPGSVSYAVVYIEGGKVNNSIISFPLPQGGAQGLLSSPRRIYCLINGEYYPCTEQIDNVVYIPNELVESYIAMGKPGLICVVKGNTSGRLLFFYTVGLDLYQIGEVVMYA
ncbi:MAG: hypothetical protein QXE81_01430 [Desulfurococcaceae archaeon]